jgi:hypothetical protein
VNMISALKIAMIQPLRTRLKLIARCDFIARATRRVTF